MPDYIKSFFQDYEPVERAGLRKRLVEDMTRRAVLLEKHADLTALQLQNPNLSSGERASLGAQKSNALTLLNKSRDFIKEIERQNAVVTAEDRELAFRPSKLREGVPLRRSTEDRNFAILGLLQRERRQHAALSRGAYARAKAVAASRKSYDVSSGSSLAGSRGYSYSVHARELLESADPCAEYRDYQRARREVMSARGYIGHGYLKPHRRRIPAGC